MLTERVTSQGYRHGYKPIDDGFINMECADCEKVNEDCKIEEIGFYCESPDDASHVQFKENAIIPSNLKKCLPKDHYFSEISKSVELSWGVIIKGIIFSQHSKHMLLLVP